VTRTLLSVAVAAGLAGAALAVPDAPAPAPAPRAAKPKFEAPKFQNHFEVLVFTNQRPVRMSLAVLNNGKAVDELWRERLKSLFDYCDRDGDGFLSEKEVRFAFSDQGLSQLLANGFYQPGAANAAKLADLDKDEDGKVSFEEFVASYPRTAAQLFRTQPAQPDFTNNAAVTEAIFKLLDANGDGKLTKDEVSAVEKYLASHDADEDECLSMQELAPNLYDPRFGGRRLGQPLPPNGNPGPAPGIDKVVNVYRAGLIPGTVTQQVIKKYDKDGDFELTRAEVGFDEATFKALDKDGNGRLDGEELDVWRTGAPDLEMSLSLAPKAADCVAKLNDEKAAEARGFKIKQVEGGRLILHVGRQPIDLWAFASTAQYAQQSLKQQYGYLFTQAAGAKKFVEEKDLNGPNAVQFQFIRVLFEAADRDGDGKMTKGEFDAYFDLQESFRNMSLTLSPGVQTPSLFQLLDENRDGRLGVRELRTAWTRLLSLEENGAEVVTRNIIQPSVTLRLSRSYDRFFVNQPAQPGFQNPNQVMVPRNGPLWFRKMDRNADGDVSRSEYVGTKAEFDAIDTDGDGLISLAEAEAWDKKMREKEAKPDKPKPDRKEQEK
jgi:Ca2+-binding EF-hand superfamily protein